ncbi:hypothetical protein CLV47_1341 [Antricoccus suffuscus]|uniref:Uncharacterized protein n=1 Tax=Antricoccus suffuscus TaxID=1629062 RepID=A0A2T0YYT5_9ACTN|nr:hypothetical protein CLV47_1341 [Antricoccus suffuscus]
MWNQPVATDVPFRSTRDEIMLPNSTCVCETGGTGRQKPPEEPLPVFSLLETRPEPDAPCGRDGRPAFRDGRPAFVTDGRLFVTVRSRDCRNTLKP